MTNLTYTQNGDYMIPNLVADEVPEGKVTRYGQMRRKFLQEHMNGIYQHFLLSGTLKSHLLTIQEQAEQRMDVLMKQMAKAQNVTEELKATDQMEWVRQMNNIRQSAEEIVLNEIIYTL